MVEFNFGEQIFPRYGLKCNPYSIEPLLIEGGHLSIETFVGREKEKNELHSIILRGGGQRCMVVGKAGVGKTSLVNYMRAQAKKSAYFSPNIEIGIQDSWKVNDVIINTLQSIYMEIKSQNIKLSDEKIINTLEDLFELSNIVQDSEITPNAVMSINTHMLMELFRRTTKEIVDTGYRAIIIQYNNLDNIDDYDQLVRLLNNLRDFFQNPYVIFFFLGDDFLPHLISFKSRLRQIFIMPEIKVPNLSYDEVKEIIETRMKALRINEKLDVIYPHSEDSLKLVYNLFEGNIRDILNSLSYSVDERNVVTLSATKTKISLIEKAKNMFLTKISPMEQEVLYAIIDAGSITNAELSDKLKKLRQNISPCLTKLKEVKAIKVDKTEGQKIFYKPETEAVWLKLEVTEKELIEEEDKNNQKIKNLQKKIKDFNFS
jgi:Cdc6-like AAA superfamily ATPase